jgi:tetratricopeptide (TPR) repeat protein
MRFARVLLLAAALAGAPALASAQAAVLPPIAEFYFDDDSAARPIEVVSSEGGDVVRRLERALQRDSRNALALGQLAGIAYASGRADTGESFYSTALGLASNGGTHQRQLMWNHGWDLFRADRHEAALDEWLKAMAAHRGRPIWAPPTLALVLAKLGREAEALEWYAAAVRTRPERFVDRAAMERGHPGWRAEDIDVLVALAGKAAATP